jgi:hypothetical protein
MRVVEADPSVVTGESDDAVYRVCVWTAPQIGNAWALDEWDISDADDVVQVIDWARAATTGVFEVFLRWSSASFDAAGHRVDEPRFTRVFGRPGDLVRATVRTEVFVSDE